jgi:DNA mismatch repair ATPase MutS
MAKSASPANTEQLDEYFTVSGNDENGEFSSSVAPVVVAIINNATTGMVGLAAADAVSFTLTLSQFTDNDLLSNVEIALIQLGAVECIVPETHGGDVFYKKLQEICSNCNIALTQLKSSEFASNLDSIEADLVKLVKDDNFASLEKSPTVLKAACGIVNYLHVSII